MQKWVLFIILIVLAIFAILYITKSGPAVKLRNASSAYDISPGVLVLHAETFSMNQIGRIASPEYQELAELGDPSLLKKLIQDREDVYRVIDVGRIKPESDKKVSLGSLGEGLENARLSYMAQIVQTNDGVVWLNSVPLTTILYMGNTAISSDEVNTYWTEILDIGSEENSPIGSGFPGGQFDSSRGDENRNHGIATEDVVGHHNQFYSDPDISAYVLGFIRSDVVEEGGDL